MNTQDLSQRIITWYQQHGRSNLPWQQPRDPYRVWLSEIMLQQTQVATVIPYFQRFIQQFPQIELLAQAELDHVLTLWSGLGYYTRARNLHKTAQLIYHNNNGCFPHDVATLQQLPGIGRSTAGAIVSLGYNRPAPILDGNVKRVLSRWHQVAGPPNRATTQRTLWELATRYTPTMHNADYTQAMMDLGATVCTKNQPQCSVCPLQSDCLAYHNGTQLEFPRKQQSSNIPTKTTCFVLLYNQDQQLLLEQRPPTGIWGGLWSFPECPTQEKIELWCQNQYGFQVNIHTQQPLTPFTHRFSHFALHITPILATVTKQIPLVKEHAPQQWINPATVNCGIPKPVTHLLQLINNGVRHAIVLKNI